MSSHACANFLYVFDGGKAVVKDISQWSPGVNVGKPMTFSNHAYLIGHGDDWLLWDTGLDDRMIDIPGGEVVAHDVRGIVSRTLASQLAEINVRPSDVTIMVFSHAHFDHVGNSRLFKRARWIVQKPEHAAMFGFDTERYGFIPELYVGMRDHPVHIVEGDHDVFGDGSVTIISTPGHTPGHQSLMVRLRKTGTIILSGDVAHFSANFCCRRVPAFNADHHASRRSIERIEALVQSQNAQLWINHDPDQSATIAHSPSWHE
jgi:N-acyl homoserine lactone hydrolase